MGVDQVSLTTLQRELNPIGAMFKIIRSEHDFPIGDPFPEFFKRLKEKLQNDLSNQPRKPYVLRSRLEELKLYGAIEQQSNNPKLQRKWLSLIRMALITALRRGVLLQLKWGDVDWEEDLLRIPSHYCHNKKNAPEILHLTIELRPLLESAL